MRTTLRTYRGFAITSFNLRQLGDPEVRGMAYSVYRDAAAVIRGDAPISSGIYGLDDAKSFIDQEMSAAARA